MNSINYAAGGGLATVAAVSPAGGVVVDLFLSVTGFCAGFLYARHIYLDGHRKHK